MPRMWIDLEELAVLLVRMVEVSVTHKGGIIVRRNMRITKSPLSYEEGQFVHRRTTSGINAVCEQGNFTRYTTSKAKAEVSR